MISGTLTDSARGDAAVNKLFGEISDENYSTVYELTWNMKAGHVL
jgi:hypothetical protein